MVRFEVLRQVIDAVGKKCNLYFGRTGVRSVLAVRRDGVDLRQHNKGLLFLIERGRLTQEFGPSITRAPEPTRTLSGYEPFPSAHNPPS